jgi:Uma2 family endonuclease
MRTVVLGQRPKALEALIESRRATGADRYDEVWEGEYHMAPAPRKIHALVDVELAASLRPYARRAGLVGSSAFNLGVADNYRVPDGGLHRDTADAVYVPTAALVYEILSPDGETWAKLPFYAAHDVDEVVIVDPATQTVTWLRLVDGDYEPTDRSHALDVAVADVVGEIIWPPAG